MKKSKMVYAAATVIAVVVIVLLYAHFSNAGSEASAIAIGSPAPNYGFLLANGSMADLAAYRSHTVVLWFVATWCPSCAQGNEALNASYQFFKEHGVRVIELELYKDLGYSGPGIKSFVESYAPSAYNNSTIIPAYAGYNMTASYDPNGYLDIYYVVSGNGKVVYINGSPAVTLGELEGAIKSSM